MGIDIDINGENVTVHGNGLRGLKKPDEMLYTGNSGTTTRLLCGILAGQKILIRQLRVTRLFKNVLWAES